ncbi:MAG: hypothetical protein L0H96_16670 [Humibacillus sp.]|nr:hypothetical protein [Humibacillus sp.]MDN5778531.1 hypothetical protein [Humibacillus sp.]
MRRTVAELAGDIAHSLVLPQGFTLCIAGTLAMHVDHHGSPGWFPVWLFLCGASLTYSALLLLLRVYRRPGVAARPPTRRAVFNVVPLAAVPLAHFATAWVSSAALSFLLAGCVVILGYVGGLALLLQWSGEPEV